MVSPRIVVADYGSGNVGSVLRMLARLGVQAALSADPKRIQDTDGVIVPGVGAFAAVMGQLRSSGLERLIERRVAGGRPVLGICVGLQVLFAEGVEHGTSTPGMGQWPGVVEKLPASVVPHVGWNTVQPPPESVLFRGVEHERFFFVHSYAAQKWEFVQTNTAIRPPALAWSHYGGPFIAAVENGPLSATQFHPEKSGAAGAALLNNWLSTTSPQWEPVELENLTKQVPQ